MDTSDKNTLSDVAKEKLGLSEDNIDLFLENMAERSKSIKDDISEVKK